MFRVEHKCAYTEKQPAQASITWHHTQFWKHHTLLFQILWIANILAAHTPSPCLKPLSTCLAVLCVMPVWSLAYVPGFLSIHPPAKDPQSSALNSRWFLSPTPSWPSAFASCLHKDVFMYVCTCKGEHEEVFQGLGGDKQRNLRPVNMDGVPAFREDRW